MNHRDRSDDPRRQPIHEIRFQTARRRTAVLGMALIALIVAAAGARADGTRPALFWVSSPVRPGETVVVVGEGFGPEPTIEVGRVADTPPVGTNANQPWPEDARTVKPVQVSDQSLKFVVPAESKPGVFVFRITGPGGAVTGQINRPRVWWVQGDRGVAASPGGWIRVFGRNIALDGQPKPSRTVVRLQGSKTVYLAAEADCYAGKVAVPADLPPGEYRLSVHHGFGGAAAWSDPVPLTIAKVSPWPQVVYDVKDFGAVGDGVKDDTQSILAALQKAGDGGGGVVHFPPGRYRVSGSLPVPRFTVLRGEKRERVAICWTDLADPPAALVRGTNSFGLEELTLYARNHRHVIAGDLGDRAGAGDVFLRRVRVRADSYRGHLKPEQVDARFRKALHWSTGGGDTVRLGGRNVRITDSDFYGSGRALFLSRVRGGYVSGNHFYNGRWGWYCISGSDGLIFKNNTITGADLMSTGGGLNCLDGSSYSQNIYYARNRLSLLHGWDREAMTSDAGGEVYFGKIAAANGRNIKLAAEPKPSRRDWIGAGVFVLAGKGAAQYRRVVRHDGTMVQIDRPWTVPPDTDSDVVINMFQGHYLLVDNEFTDTGAMQFYGTSIECLVAGNRGARMQGFRDLGLWYHGYQPSWFCQFLDNEITEGNYYHFDAANEAVLEVYGAKRPPLKGPLNRATVVRRNRLLNDAHIRVAGMCRDTVVERNHIENAGVGIFIGQQADAVLVRGNRFQNVAQEVLDQRSRKDKT